MKPFLTLTLTLVLTAALLMGCGCTNSNRRETTPTTTPTTMPTTEATTVPTTQPVTEEPSSTGNGMLEDETMDTGDNTEATDGAMENNARSMMPGSSR